MKKLYNKTNISLLGLVAFAAMSIYSATGPGSTFGMNVTGAPFDAGTCTNCHTPGSNYSATLSLQLLSGTTPVTSYTPGNSYTVRITRSAPGLVFIANGGFGFQITCATAGTNTNINNWGSLPSNTTNVSLNSRNYIEHTSKFPNSTTQVNIPWTAPSLGTGTVSFYIALNTVNGNFNNTNDQVLTTSINITENPLPVTWLYFKGKVYGQDVFLEWGVASEKNSDYYSIEKSTDGKDFKTLATIYAQENSSEVNKYSYIDEYPLANNYYRIKQTDRNGEESYSKTIQVLLNENHLTQKAYHYVNGDHIIVNYKNDNDLKPVTISLYDMSGKMINKKEMIMNKDRNAFIIPKPHLTGMYFISLRERGDVLYGNKVWVE